MLIQLIFTFLCYLSKNKNHLSLSVHLEQFKTLEILEWLAILVEKLWPALIGKVIILSSNYSTCQYTSNCNPYAPTSIVRNFFTNQLHFVCLNVFPWLDKDFLYGLNALWNLLRIKATRWTYKMDSHDCVTCLLRRKYCNSVLGDFWVKTGRDCRIIFEASRPR